MKLSELTYIQRCHLAWRLDSKTSCGYITAFSVAKGNHGDMELVEIFEKYGGKSNRSAKYHAKKVINFSLRTEE